MKVNLKTKRSSDFSKICLFTAIMLLVCCCAVFGIFYKGVNSARAANIGNQNVKRQNHSYFDNLVNFNSFAVSETVGVTTNPRPGDYNLRQRGPENISQGEALAYSSLRDTEDHWGGNVNHYRHNSLQVFIGIGGDLKAAILNGIITSLSFDFGYGLGALVTDKGSTCDAFTYFDLSYNRITDDTWDVVDEVGTVFSGSREKNYSGSRNSRGETIAVDKAAGQDSWGWKQKNVTFGANATAGVKASLNDIANNNGFWLKLYAYTHIYGTGPFDNVWTQVALTFEGVKYNATFEDRSVTFQTNDPVNGLKTVSKSFYEKTAAATLSGSTAAGTDGLYFTSWSGDAVASDPKKFDVTTVSYLSSPAANNNVVANYALIPIDGQKSYSFNALQQGPSASAPEGYTVVNESYTGANFTGVPYSGTDKPVSAGNYVYHAELERDGEIMGEVDYNFTIARTAGAAGTLVMSKSWTYGEHTGVTPYVTGQTEEYSAPTFQYLHNKTGSWVSDMPIEPGSHYARANFTSTNNYLADETPWFEFEIYKIAVSLPSVSDGLTYNDGEQVNSGLLDTELYTVGGEKFGVDAGGYTAVLTLTDPAHYMWDNGISTADAEITWAIGRLDISGIIEVMFEDYAFTYIENVPQIPDFTVMYNDTELTEGVHFIIPEFEAVNAGTKRFLIELAGNYKGDKIAEYTIAPQRVERPVGTEYTYDGAEKMAGEWLKDNDFYEIIEADGFTSSATAAGQYKTAVQISAAYSGNYVFDNGAAVLVINWEILPAALTEDALIFDIPEEGYTYNALSQFPDIVIIDSTTGYTLIEGIDYTVSEVTPFNARLRTTAINLYAASSVDSVNAGFKTVLITLMGNYSGSFTRTYEIKKAEVAVPVFNGGLVYNAANQIPGEWIADCDAYTVSGITESINAGDFTVTLTLSSDNYAWDDALGGLVRNIEWSIAKVALSDGALSLSTYEFTYNSASQRPEISVSAMGFGELVLGKDYILADFDDINAGIKAVKVDFIGNFSGSAQKTYNILRAESVVNIVIAPHGVIYTSGTLPVISLGEGSTDGVVEWKPHKLEEGVKSYYWRYTSTSGNYTEREGFVEFTAVLAVLKDIRLISSPDKLSYKAFEKLNTVGLRVEIINDDGNIAGEINFLDTTAYSVVYQNGDSFRAGDTYITIVYQTKTVVIDVTVSKAVPVFTTPVDLSAVYGDTLGDVALEAGFSFESPLSTLVGNAGSNLFTVSFIHTDTDNYEAVYGIEVYIEVGKKASVVTPVFGTIDMLYTSGALPSISLSAGGTAGTISWDAYTLTEGEYGYSWTFTPANPNYTVVIGVKNYTAVVAGFLEIRLVSMPALVAYNAFDAVNLSGAEIEVITEDGLSAGMLDLSSGDYQVVYANGTGGLYANETGFIIRYNGFDLTVPVTVSKIAPQFILPDGLTAVYGDLLSSVALPEGFSFASSGKVGNAGQNSFTVTFTPNDLVNYNIVEVTVTVSVSKASASVIAENAISESMVSSTTESSFTVAPPNTGFEQELEYAISTDGNAPDSGWQTELEFGSLESDTVYYIFARPKADENFEVGEAVLIDEVRTAAIGSVVTPPTVVDNKKQGMPLGILLAVIFASAAVVALAGFAIYFFGVKKRSIKEFLIGETNSGGEVLEYGGDVETVSESVLDPFGGLEEPPVEMPID